MFVAPQLFLVKSDGIRRIFLTIFSTQSKVKLLKGLRSSNLKRKTYRNSGIVLAYCGIKNHYPSKNSSHTKF